MEFKIKHTVFIVQTIKQMISACNNCLNPTQHGLFYFYPPTQVGIKWSLYLLRNYILTFLSIDSFITASVSPPRLLAGASLSQTAVILAPYLHMWRQRGIFLMYVHWLGLGLQTPTYHVTN